jgi:hypothetical protein
VSRDEPAQVAAHVPAFNEAADWAELGSYAVFQYLPRDKTAPERICPGITALRPRPGLWTAMMSAGVRATAQCAWSTVSYMVSFFRFGGGMGSRPRRVHSRIGGAAVASNVCA